jgi:hypothetical protein
MKKVTYQLNSIKYLIASQLILAKPYLFKSFANLICVNAKIEKLE